MKKRLVKPSVLFLSIGYILQSHAQQVETQQKEGKEETLSVYTSPFQIPQLNMTTPISVVTEDELVSGKRASIAETLQDIPGFHASYFGGGAVNPVIRGMSGNRVKIMNNGSELMDVSAMGADHAITSEPFLSRQIEIVKGPATLLYGGGTIGGAVNVIDTKIPTAVPDKGYVGELNYQYDSVSRGNTGAGGITLGQENLVFRVEGVTRDHSNYKQPDTGRLPGSYQKGDAANVAGSWIFDGGYLGVGYGEQTRRYGLPGHTHFDHDTSHDTSHDTGHTHGLGGPYPDEIHEHSIPYIDMHQKRWNIRGEKTRPFVGIESVRFNVARTDYRHDEKEGSAVATRFKNKGDELRFSLTHESLFGWRGIFGGLFNQRDFSAQGEEAYVPPTKTKNQALFLLEENQTDAWRYELGLSHEWQSVLNKDTYEDLKKNATSASAGISWNFVDDYSLKMSLSHAKRLPVAEELYANGVHKASRTIETGNADLKAETANNIDIGIMKSSGDIQFSVSAYYNRIKNYIYGEITNEALSNGYRTLQYSQRDAEFKGVEGHVDYYYDEDSLIGGAGDVVRAKLLHNQGYIPRMPTWQVSLYVKHAWNDSLTSQIRWDHFGEQDKVAKYESTTSSYNTVSIGTQYVGHIHKTDFTLYAKMDNILNKSARDSTSYIKDEMLLPGRNFIFGVNLNF
ncbi:TonB-dependent receptor domain-containing protein [Enterobacter cloacae]|uniref:TonB-dependent receptor domain-containing protein n=1 Tax=Enterobacter cloacae TaxID=550 RepID=UPI000B8DBB3C|nr:TonB-dependent receptor [Enterobacter cloacae]ASQ15698.1 putative TonB-dependent receptor [Enterobacter cloacae]